MNSNEKSQIKGYVVQADAAFSVADASGNARMVNVGDSVYVGETVQDDTVDNIIIKLVSEESIVVSRQEELLMDFALLRAPSADEEYRENASEEPAAGLPPLGYITQAAVAVEVIKADGTSRFAKEGSPVYAGELIQNDTGANVIVTLISDESLLVPHKDQLLMQLGLLNATAMGEEDQPDVPQPLDGGRQFRRPIVEQNEFQSGFESRQEENSDSVSVGVSFSSAPDKRDPTVPVIRNEQPDAAPVTLETLENQATVTDNFVVTDLNGGDTHTFRVVSEPSKGRVINNDNGTFNFVPGNDFQYLAEGDAEIVTFEYEVVDNSGWDNAVSDPAIVTITVTGTNDAPIATVDNGRTTENSQLIVDVVANDKDVDAGAKLSLAAASIGGARNNADNQELVLDTASVSFTDQEVVFNPGADFDYLAVGEQATVVVNYTVTEDNSSPLTSNSTLTITVTGTNDKPVAEVVTGSTDEETILQGSFSATDTDVTDSLSYSIVSQPAEGSVANNEDGTFSFNPDSDFQDLAAGESRNVTFTYQATDDPETANATSETKTVTITVTGTNDKPVAEVVTGSTDEDTILQGSFSATDTDATDSLSYSIVSQPAEGSVANNEDGTFSFNPGSDFQDLAAGESRNVTFTYQATDDSETANATSETKTVTITVTGTNDKPVAEVVTGSTDEDTILQGSFGVTDIDATDSLSYSIVSQPAEGSVANNEDGTFSFNPDSDFQDLAAGESRNVTFTYQATDDSETANATSETQTVTITVTGTNDKPVAEVVTGSTDEETILQGSFSATDTDVTDSLSYSIVSQPAEGSVANNEDGTFSFNPDSDFQDLAAGESRNVTFTYQATDDSETANATSETKTVTITVTGTNDKPVAEVVTGSTDEETILQGSFSATDTDATDSLSYSIVSQPAEGSVANNEDGTFSFNPDSDFQDLAAGESRNVTFTYQATDDSETANATSETQTVTITVTGTNDKPVAEVVTGSTDEETILQGSFGVTDTDVTDSLSYSIVSQPAEGSVANNEDGTFSFNPDSDFQDLAAGESRNVTFTYQATDDSETANATSETQTVTITVTGTNDKPVAEVVTGSTDEETILQGSFSATDTDATDSLSYSIVSQPAEGSVANNEDGTFSFNPDSDFQDLAAGESRNVTFTYQATDDSETANATSETQTVTITVTGTNDKPVAEVVTGSTDEETILQGSFGVTDIDATDSLSYSIVSQPAEGSVANNEDGTFSFNPDSDFQDLAAGESRNVTFTYQATDDSETANATSETQTVTITVTGTNDKPVAEVVTGSTDEDTILQGSFSATDTDATDSLSYSIVSQPAEGSVANNEDGTFSFNPGSDFQDLAAGESRNVTFTYQATDDSETANATSETKTVTITVIGTNDKPVAEVVTGSTDEDTILQGSFGVTDIDATDSLSYSIVSQPAEGSVANNEDGTFSFNPDSDFQDLAAGESRNVTFTYQATDDSETANATSETQTVTITVTGTNDKPVAEVVTGSTDEDGAIAFSQEQLLANASDVDGDDLSAINLSSGADSTITNNSDGTFTVTPDADFNGDIRLSFDISDGQGGVVESGVDLTVNPVNDAPVIGNGIEEATLGGDSDWVLAGDAEITNGEGTIVKNAKYQKGAMFYDHGFDSDKGIRTTFDFQVDPEGGRRIGDGMAISFHDGSQLDADNFRIGLGGGGLGATGLSTDFLTIGFDAFQHDWVEIRGSDDELITYFNVAGYGGIDHETVARSVKIEITESGGLILDMSFNGGNSFIRLINGMDMAANGIVIPDTVKMMYSGSTGGSTAEMTIANVEVASIAGTEQLTVAKNTSYLIIEDDLLINATDIDSTDLSVTDLALVIPSLGTLADNGDGTWAFTSANNYNGEVEFGYSVSDGELATQAPHFSLVVTPPVVIDLDGDGLELITLDESDVFIDIDNDGDVERTAWIGRDDGFIITDLDGDRTLSSNKELFIAQQTTEHDTDLEALATLYDSNQDGVLNSLDDRFDDVLIFQDKNQDGNADEGEIFTLQDMNIQEINLDSDNNRQHLSDGSVIHGQTTYSKTDGTEGIVGDVSLAYLDLSSNNKEHPSSGDINNCNTDEGDVLKLDDLIVNPDDSIDQLLDFSTSGADTIVDISTIADGDITKPATLENVDFTSYGSTDIDIINGLLDGGNFQIDE